MTMRYVLRILVPLVMCSCAEAPTQTESVSTPAETGVPDGAATPYELSTDTRPLEPPSSATGGDGGYTRMWRDVAPPDVRIATEPPGDAGLRTKETTAAPSAPQSATPATPQTADAARPGSGDASPSDAASKDASSVPVQSSDCAHSLHCALKDIAQYDRCLERTKRDALAQLQAVVDCEGAKCSGTCDGEGGLHTDCETCLLLHCALAYEGCLRSSGCGDGFVDPETEACDDGNDVSTDACTNACTRPICGDGIVSPSTEACDDGNNAQDDTCLSRCIAARCGDGVLRRGVEGCDDGNDLSGDGCSEECQMEGCGNGLLEPPEECDEGVSNGSDRPCLDTCRVNRCGDGRVCSNEDAGCGVRYGSKTESCDDGNDVLGDGCNACQHARCGDGVVDVSTEQCDDGNLDPFDSCWRCRSAADHLLITEIAVSPAGAEMIEIFNPTPRSIDLSEYGLSDSARYAEVAGGTFSTASGSDFAARFPPGSVLGSGAYATIAIANADGPGTGFRATYGRLPNFELRPTANGSTDDPSVPNMESMTTNPSSIGSNASLTDAGEPIVLFRARTGQPILDVDYVYFGNATTSNPVVDKTALVVAGYAYAPDTSNASQHPVSTPSEGGSVHRCLYAESSEEKHTAGDAGAAPGGNGTTGHDETAEDWQRTFVVNANSPERRTPGAAAPADLCGE